MAAAEWLAYLIYIHEFLGSVSARKVAIMRDF
jgi:hypothetical protein